jgi:phenylalanyl-tRNA synthetase beta subunit
MVKILRSWVSSEAGDVVTVPSWRGDVTHYSDLAER